MRATEITVTKNTNQYGIHQIEKKGKNKLIQIQIAHLYQYLEVNTFLSISLKVYYR